MQRWLRVWRVWSLESLPRGHSGALSGFSMPPSPPVEPLSFHFVSLENEKEDDCLCEGSAVENHSHTPFSVYTVPALSQRPPGTSLEFTSDTFLSVLNQTEEQHVTLVLQKAFDHL